MLSLAALGFLAGTIGAMFGIGGGFFIIPALNIYFDMPIKDAMTISLIAITASACAASAGKIKKGFVNIKLGILLGGVSVPGAILGAIAANSINAQSLKAGFSLFLMAISALMIKKGFTKFPAVAAGAEGSGRFSAQFYDPAENKTFRYEPKNIKPACALSFFAGIISGVLGIGGGVMQVPIINAVLKVPLKAAAATANFAVIVSSLAGALIFLSHNRPDIKITAVIILGVLAGSGLGVKIMTVAKQEKLYILLGLIMASVGIKMFASL
ncbi:MAG: sulfite exporter TauE/SafE family protein [Elusimicrobia bacterium]|nr:sulfite exporter TauE/SafE family protein [Elusimicrobiota bacterium]